MQGKIHGIGLKMGPTDKHGFHFYTSAPHPGTKHAEMLKRGIPGQLQKYAHEN